MPSESDVIRRMITATGTLMTEWSALPPSAPPISRLRPRHTKQLLMKRIMRRSGSGRLAAGSHDNRGKRRSLCCVLASALRPGRHRAHAARDAAGAVQTHLSVPITAVLQILYGSCTFIVSNTEIVTWVVYNISPLHAFLSLSSSLTVS